MKHIKIRIKDIYLTKSSLKIIYILCIIISFLSFNKKIKNNYQLTKVCICTIGKNENRYIREFVEYYKKIGVDKIFLYDNNDLDKENFKTVIKDYIDKEYVQIFNWRGIKAPHFKAINDCYLRYNKYYNWLIFYDVDEYIHLYNYGNIKDFLNDKKFNKRQKIYLNWVFHTDNNQIHYQNISLFKRFPEIERDAIINKNFIQKVKSILRGNISDFVISKSKETSHIITNSVKGCNGFGKEINLLKENLMKNSDTKFYYIDHFYTKSLEEFVDKINRGSAVNGKSIMFKLYRIIRYFSINKLKYFKFNYIMKKSGLYFEIKKNY